MTRGLDRAFEQQGRAKTKVSTQMRCHSRQAALVHAESRTRARHLLVFPLLFRLNVFYDEELEIDCRARLV